MIDNIIKSIFGDPDKKKLKQYYNIVEKIKEFENEFANFSLEDVKNKTLELKLKFEWLNFENETDSIKIKEIIEEIIPIAFVNLKQATKLISWKEFILASWKIIVWNMIPYDVQLVGWIAINNWNIAEMKTWEWKTLVATLPAYLNALTWNPVHIITVNDYLARRDSEEMWILYNILWLTVWVITHNQNHTEKHSNYHADIVYATNNEMWFDYLRDNMVTKASEKVMSKPFFAIIDEVDSILIDEARTPLIISMPDNEPTSKYMQFAIIASDLQNWIDYKIDEKQKTTTLTPEWITKIEKILWIDNIYISERYNDLHHIENALKAVSVYRKDKDYLVLNGEVMIIDEHTWRVLSGRRYSEWLHQAIEAKEKVEIKRESKTLASITFQNYFRMYWKLAGMTWTAKTEEEEFYKVYALEVLSIPTNRPIKREDRSDLLFKNEKGKFEYTVKLIKEVYSTWQPILVWTISVEKSEYLSQKLKEINVPHNVLNAKQHETESMIVANAWLKWSVTIATNMAWRWTDIKLWEWVVDLWWLYIIWTEKHETRRIDNQLRWRAWRQWDPWITQFLISPQDEIMRIFGWDKLFGMFNSPMFASLPDDEPLAQSNMLTSRITSVQKQVEWYHFDTRKHVLEYDDVINKHREIIYSRRNKALLEENIDDFIKEKVKNQLSTLISWFLAWNEEKTSNNFAKKINDFTSLELINNDFDIHREENFILEEIKEIAIKKIDEIKANFKDEKDFYNIEKQIVLQSIDELWMRHIDSMSKLRESVAFEWYAQKQPLLVYKEKSFEKFRNLINEIDFKTSKWVFAIEQNIVINQIEINEKNIEVNDTDEVLIKSLNELNPLFNIEPTVKVKQANNFSNSKTKIRV